MNRIRQGLMVSALTFCSRLLGLLRETVTASLFGSSAATDAFYTVFRLPNAMRQILAEGAFSTTLLPLWHEMRARAGAAAAALMAWRVLHRLLAWLVVAALLLWASSSWWLQALDAQAYGLAQQMLPWVLAYLVLAGYAGWSAALLHAHERMLVPALAPLLLSGSMIALPLWLGPHYSEPVLCLALAVALGAALQAGAQAWALNRVFSPGPSGSADPHTASLAHLLLPGLFAAAVPHLNLWIDSLFAAGLAPGSASWLYLADRVLQFPLGIVGTALAVVLAQHLAQRHALRDGPGFVAALDHALRLLLLLTPPLVVGAWQGAEAITALLYRYGAFSATDAAQTAQVLRLWVWVIPALLLCRTLTAATLALGWRRQTVLAAAAGLGADVLGHLIVLYGIGDARTHLDIARVNTAACWVYALLLVWVLRRHIRLPAPALVVPVLIASGACALLGALVLNGIGAATEPLLRLWRVTAHLGTVLCGFALVLYVLGVRPRQFRDSTNPSSAGWH